eukprot:CAMPEP_0117423598 /NCGR_PEP_ID=MMETSP0758-20121206/4172_1 /TAXON_ID=63605 /ORGANISM="Percolomonas cosmopolitus, Strain AE-1 (ATCC 50343)" /LENGTH=1078 /DNA_ID=CAMNT_0005206847 /DNA_START=433 /DNA_END=3669 /DNA_ORIENTATION=-
MQPTFMESVWWVFKQLYDKDLVYRHVKVMPYSTQCTTPLSNFESKMNYQDVSDPEVYATFPIKDVADDKILKDAEFLAWTTTPWTLPSNLALCVNKDFDYLVVYDHANYHKFLVAECRLRALIGKKKTRKISVHQDQNDQFLGYENEHDIFMTLKKMQGKPSAQKLKETLDIEEEKLQGFLDVEMKKFHYTILSEKMKGSDLVGRHYEPLFDYFKQMMEKTAFRVVEDPYVKDDSGTGIVHQAPGFGEDDFRVCEEHGIILKGEYVPCPVDDEGKFTNEVPDFFKTYVKDADKTIIATLKKAGRLYRQGSYVHSYPFCWRSNTPLIQRAIPAWFVNVEKIKEKLLANNKTTYWVPEEIQTKRFNNWLEGAKDWGISRSRYWGTPIPIWTNDDLSEIVVIGSIEELKERSGVEVTDLHSHFIDKITIPSADGKGVLRRIPDVFDCWFESGSMPYAQCHYPFENKESFQDRFPADFIAEGLDQTRGWFYTLMVLGTALFDKAPFKNVVVNGIVRAADGKKMSKSLKNYPAPELMINKYGADAIRLYLINSPVVRAESLQFKERGVNEVVTNVFNPWFNAYRFFVQQANVFESDNGSFFDSVEAETFKPTNIMDRWIISRFQSLVKHVHEKMKKYFLSQVIPELVTFIDQLTNWYVRINRPRLKGQDTTVQDRKEGLMTTYRVLLGVCELMAPFTPFLTETMYQNLKMIIPEDKRFDSVHFVMLPEYNPDFVDEELEKAIERMQEVMIAGRDLRKSGKKLIPSKMPLSSFSLVSSNKELLNHFKDVEELFKRELNVREVIYESDIKKYFTYKGELDRKLGRQFKKAFGKAKKEVEAYSHDELLDMMTKDSITIQGVSVNPKDAIVLSRHFIGDSARFNSAEVTDCMVILDVELNDRLRQDGALRDLTSAIMQLRKTARLLPLDPSKVYFKFGADSKLEGVVRERLSEFSEGLPNMEVVLDSFEEKYVFIDNTHSVFDLCGEYAEEVYVALFDEHTYLPSIKAQRSFYLNESTVLRTQALASHKKITQLSIANEKQSKDIATANREVKKLEEKVTKLLEKLKEANAEKAEMEVLIEELTGNQ